MKSWRSAGHDAATSMGEADHGNSEISGGTRKTAMIVRKPGLDVLRLH